MQDYAKIGLLISLPAVLVASPWVCYLFYHYPTDIGLVFSDFLTRTDNVFEGHTGGPFFYLEQVIIQFRGAILLPLGWLVYELTCKHDFRKRLLAGWIFLPLIILSMMTTKRGTYLMMSAPAYFLVTAYFLEYLRLRFAKTKRQRNLTVLGFILLIGLPAQYTLEQVKPFQTRFEKPAWRIELARQIALQQIATDYLVFHNCPKALDAMFYHDVQAYLRKLNPAEIDKFEQAGYQVVDYSGLR